MKKKENFYLNVPTFIFRDRRISVLEALVVYLKDNNHLSFAEIARMLDRDDRTIWTSYNRAKKKLGEKYDR